ncbi:uncharacterized protein LOC126851875 [Cataglyphis hispanica]|uniref:uncharacterized protein LOC126851875 n=1 Tax=Cataglyphis hispanica TaxID=1086592 RepID=UPI00217F5CE0|nr:uncharacterized protein LOC126851875 [Cataglyphis hispanica]
MEKLSLRKSCSSEEETCYEAYKNSNISDEEQPRFFRKRNINRITSDSDSDTDTCADSQREDTISDILQELIIEEERNVDTEECAIQFSEWNEFSCRQQLFPFIGTGGLIRELPSDISPYDSFALFVDDEVIDLLVLETNRYAEQKLNKSELTPSSRMHKWTPTNSEEIKKFLGLMLWMGFVKANPVSNYWSKII